MLMQLDMQQAAEETKWISSYFSTAFLNVKLLPPVCIYN